MSSQTQIALVVVAGVVVVVVMVMHGKEQERVQKADEQRRAQDLAKSEAQEHTKQQIIGELGAAGQGMVGALGAFANQVAKAASSSQSPSPAEQVSDGDWSAPSENGTGSGSDFEAPVEA